MPEILIKKQKEADAGDLSELLAAYVTETRRGAPRRRDRVYVEGLLNDPKIEFLGARLDGQLVGYALFYDLPEVSTGRRRGAVDDIFVDVHRRRMGVGTALLRALETEGKSRRWEEMRWVVPRGSQSGAAFSSAKGEPAREETFRIQMAPSEQAGEA